MINPSQVFGRARRNGGQREADERGIEAAQGAALDNCQR